MEFNNIKQIIDNWDPIDLINTHCPPDEYDSETKKIINKIDNGNIDEMAKIIQNVFINAFGIENFNKSLDECKEIAKQIITQYNV